MCYLLSDAALFTKGTDIPVTGQHSPTSSVRLLITVKVACTRAPYVNTCLDGVPYRLAVEVKRLDLGSRVGGNTPPDSGLVYFHLNLQILADNVWCLATNVPAIQHGFQRSGSSAIVLDRSDTGRSRFRGIGLFSSHAELPQVISVPVARILSRPHVTTPKDGKR